MCAVLGESRKYFNLHLLRTNVVSDVLGSDGQFVGAGDGMVGNGENAGIGGGFGIPAQCDRALRHPSAPPGCASLSEALTRRSMCLATLKALAVKFHLHHWRLAGNDECLRLAIGVSDLIAQDQAHSVGSVLHVGGRKKASLPDVFGGKIAKRLH